MYFSGYVLFLACRTWIRKILNESGSILHNVWKAKSLFLLWKHTKFSNNQLQTNLRVSFLDKLWLYHCVVQEHKRNVANLLPIILALQKIVNTSYTTLQSCQVCISGLQIYIFFWIAIGVELRMKDIGKNYLFTFCEIFENVYPVVFCIYIQSLQKVLTNDQALCLPKNHYG